MLSENWIEQYLNKRRQEQEENELALLATPSLFQKIKTRIERDLQTFHEAEMLEGWELKESPQSFAVYAKSHDLTVSLRGTAITFAYSFPYNATDFSGAGFFRVCAKRDDGSIRIIHRADGVAFNKAFTDESEVSEFLLRPVLDFVYKDQS